MGGWRGAFVAVLVLACIVWRAAASCDEVAADRCVEEFDRCRLFGGPVGDSETLCECGRRHYDVCIRTAGCTAEYMARCVSDSLENDCETDVCGIVCGLSNAQVVGIDTVTLPVNNFGRNYLRLALCNKTVDAHKLNSFGVIELQQCAEHEFIDCDTRVAPSMMTAVVFRTAATYLRVERCTSPATDTNCLTNPPPALFYGAANSKWPSSVDIEFSNATYCATDDDCIGSTCDTRHSPPVCDFQSSFF